MKLLKTQFYKNGKVEVTVKENKEESIFHFGNVDDYKKWISIQKYKRNSKLAFYSFLGLAVFMALFAWAIAISQFIILLFA